VGLTVLTLYTRPECHLCDEARGALMRLREELPSLRVEEVNIELDPRLHAAYLERIPVVEVGDEVVSELELDPDQLRRKLDTVQP
jgi:hypothetical protein